jgi:predicted SprT family Zn-dependent metalloprotease
MKVGDTLDAVALGHTAIDVKRMARDAGYVMPQGSVAKLGKVPPEVAAEVAKLEAEREQYERSGDVAVFDCQHCEEHNSSEWRRDVATGQEFLACGVCNRVVKVR